MSALLALLPTLLQIANNPAVAQLAPLITQLLQELGHSSFAGVDPAKAQAAGAALFDTNAVKWTQTGLNILGEKLDVDGVYGDSTKAAIRKFQETHGLKVDGWAGELTQEELRFVLAQPRVAA